MSDCQFIGCDKAACWYLTMPQDEVEIEDGDEPSRFWLCTEHYDAMVEFYREEAMEDEDKFAVDILGVNAL